MFATVYRIPVLSALYALTVMATEQPAPLAIDYPLNGSVFPPDMVAPTFLYRDPAAAAKFWRIEIAFGDGAAALHSAAKGERPKIGEIDQRCIAPNNELPKLTPQEAVSWIWKPDDGTWAAIKQHSAGKAATVTISGFAGELSKQVLSRGSIRLETSRDPVGAPIFYRDVPLMPAETEQGTIKPLDKANLPLIAWRLRSVSSPKSRLLLTGMYTCANCHSFSLDGKTLGMDLDGPKNHKGMYALMPIKQQVTIEAKDVLEWRTLAGKVTGEVRVGFMSQVSPDGKYIATMIQGLNPKEKDTLNNFYSANFKDYKFLQVFYPTRGMLAWYSKESGMLQPLPGADDPRYVHTNVVWTPDGKELIFARAAARDAYVPGVKMAERPNDPNETQIQYDLYRIPFNGGKGGKPEHIAGASENGFSNAFPKVSPDGKWIVFTRSRNGQLMRPDGKLYIVPVGGGEARMLEGNTPLMNSWHSFSPNSRWLVFSSKSRGPYTKMFLTHIDEAGNSSPAILIEDSTAANRAVNLPEFVNIAPDGLTKIDVPATDFYRSYNIAWELAQKGKYNEAVGEWKKALALNPGEAGVHLNLGVALARGGKSDEAIGEYRKALELDPNDPETHYRLGMSLADGGKFNEAVASYEKGLSLSPKDASPSDLATVYDFLGRARAGKGDMVGALKDLAEAVRLHPNFAPYLYDQGLVLVQVNRFDEAQRSVEAALQSNPEMVEAHELLGGLYGKKRQLESAAREYQLALKLRPDLSRLHLALANVLAAQGNKQAAVQHFRDAAKGDDPAVAQMAARELRELGLQ
jgi:tetratricopeptide (TPR) repeat protein